MGSLSYQASFIQPSGTIDGTAGSIKTIQYSVSAPGLPDTAIHVCSKIPLIDSAE
jgi:hypothetical protein